MSSFHAPAGRGHRQSASVLSLSPAGLAVGLALKEMRYADFAAIRPRPTGHLVPPRPVFPRGFGFDGRGHASSRATRPDGKARCLRAKCNEVAIGRCSRADRRYGRRPSPRRWPRRRRPAPVRSPGGMRPVAGAADLDRVQDALLVERRRARRGSGPVTPWALDRGERVAALAGLDEELLAVLLLSPETPPCEGCRCAPIGLARARRSPTAGTATPSPT